MRFTKFRLVVVFQGNKVGMDVIGVLGAMVNIKNSVLISLNHIESKHLVTTEAERTLEVKDIHDHVGNTSNSMQIGSLIRSRNANKRRHDIRIYKELKVWN